MLTMAGLEVEAVEDRYAYLEPFGSAASSSEPAPPCGQTHGCAGSKREGAIQVVCGAPNAAVG
jgi:phenylalanyl-tRNA synthetase beta chain